MSLQQHKPPTNLAATPATIYIYTRMLGIHLFYTYLNLSISRLARPLRQGREEEAHPAHLLRPADLRAGEDVRADEVPGGAGARQAGLRPRHVRISSEGEPPRMRSVKPGAGADVMICGERDDALQTEESSLNIVFREVLLTP